MQTSKYKRLPLGFLCETVLQLLKQIFICVCDMAIGLMFPVKLILKSRVHEAYYIYRAIYLQIFFGVPQHSKYMYVRLFLFLKLI